PKSEDSLQHKPNIVIGDYNSHSSSWAYKETNDDGEAVEIWAQGEDMVLIHDNKLPPSFNSGRWKKGYNLDLIFVKKVKCISRKHISRGYRTHHIPGLSSEIMDNYNTYINLFENNPFEEQTRNKGEELTNVIAQEKRNKWHELLNKTDMKHSSKKAWGLIKRLNSDPTSVNGLSNVAPNQIAHQLLLNAIAVQHDQFENVEEKLSTTLDILGNHYRRNYLKPNPSKMQVCVFHLRNRYTNPGEYASPVWGRSSHAKKLDVALKESCRLINGCLKNTPVKQLYILSEIAPPPIRRSTQANWERTKITADPRHPMYGITPQLPHAHYLSIDCSQTCTP
ncbi:hypothetical protein AGLY_017464, partial [Aphis glycines]